MASTFSTPKSLMERLSDPLDLDAREKFALHCQRPITVFAKKLGVPRDEIPDFVQTVFHRIFKNIAKFKYDKSKGRFRGWLFTLMRNQRREDLRKRRPQDDGQDVEELADPDAPALELELAEFHQHIVRQALRVMRSDFEESTWRACWESVVSDKSADEIAKELGITRNAVYKARSNVLRRLRQELAGILD